MKRFTKRLPVELASGKIFEVRMQSITSVEEFTATYNLLAVELQDEKYKSLNIIDAFGQEPLIKKYITDLLGIVGLKFDEVPADVLYDLLFPHQNEDGSYERQGLLLTFLRGEPKEGQHVSKENVDAYARALAQLWHSTSSFTEALNILETLNYDDLAEVIKERNELAKSPEQKAKEKAQANAKKAIQAHLKVEPGKKLTLGKEIDLNSII